jgi:outer membrane biosynthesis protein TonB
MSAPLLLTAAILGVIVLHALSLGWRRNPEVRLTFALRIPLASAWQGRTRSRIATLITATLLMLLSVVLVVPPTAGSPVLTVESGVADPGSRVSVSGAGFEHQLEGVLALDGNAAGMPGFHVRDNGTFEEPFDLPANLTPGLHVISALAPGELAKAELTVASAPSGPSNPSASLTPTPEETVTQIPAPTPVPTTTPTPDATPASALPSTATSAPRPNPTPPQAPVPTRTPAPPPPPPPSGSITHVIVVWMENEEATAITSSSMPYLYGLSQTYGRADQYYAVAHPSLPNYLALWSGSTQGVTDDGNYNLSAPSLSNQMTTAGRSWRTYAQNYPSTAGCQAGTTYSGGVDGWGVAGTYARKHNPAMSFTYVSGSTECANIQPLASFDPSVNVAFVVPNLCNDMHDCSLATGDRFLQAFLPNVFNAPDWTHTLLIVSFDEGSTSTNGGGRVFTMVARSGLAGFTSTTNHNHYGLLRTIESIFGLPCLNSSCSATALSEFLP